MANLIISVDGLADFGALDKPLQKKVREVFAKFAAATHAGLHLEKLQGALDPRVRTVRIDKQYRGIVMAPESGDSFMLHRILSHGDADKWVVHNQFGVNAATGALEVQDVVALEGVASKALPEPAGPERLFAEIKAKDLVKLGIPENILPLIERLSDSIELEALCTVLPRGQSDALHMLAAGYTVEEAWAELVAGEDPGAVDTEDVAAAVQRPASQATFYVAAGMDELLDVLNQPFAAWRVFLHPNQRRLAYRPQYNGPVRVTGGAGTGKTVVAIHRARALADLSAGTDDRILFTTFTRNLANAIENDLKLLAGPSILDRIDVINVDRFAAQVVREAEGKPPKLVASAESAAIWDDVVDESGCSFTPTFLDQELQQVVLARGISSRDEYLTTPRPGRGIRLNRRQRIEVWAAIEAYTNRLVQSSKRTYLQLADVASGLLDGRSVKPYRHVVVDEAQDLHPAQWRMLRAAVEESPNDLFIVGDAHQRIYDRRVTLSNVGINIRGRSHRLRINYRTTHEILRWSLGLLQGEPFDDLDGNQDTLVGYRSQIHGPEPEAVGFASRQEQLKALGAVLQGWIDAGIDPADIGVTARTNELCHSVVQSLASHGIAAAVLDADGSEGEPHQLAVGTMHRIKGLEFRCVAVVDAGSQYLPLHAALTPVADDPVEHERNVLQERCLLYVACTRARDRLYITWTGQPSKFVEPLL